MRITNRLLVIVVAVIALLAAGCGDDGGGDSAGDGDSGGDTETTAEETTTTEASSPEDEEAARSEISEAFATVFDGSLSFDERVAGLERGEELRPFLEEQAQILGEEAENSSGEVTDISFTGAESAQVTFTVLLNDQPRLPNTSGTAVTTDDGWKMSAVTLCDLLSLGGQSPPECTDIVAESQSGS